MAPLTRVSFKILLGQGLSTSVDIHVKRLSKTRCFDIGERFYLSCTMLLALQQNCHSPVSSAAQPRGTLLASSRYGTTQHRQVKMPDLDYAIQRILDATEYGSHPRLRLLDSPITRAFKAEDQESRHSRPNSANADHVARQGTHGSLLTPDEPQRLSPGLKRAQSIRRASRTHSVLDRNSHLTRASSTGTSTSPVHRQRLEIPHLRHIHSSDLIRTSSPPLSAATRHAQVMKRRAAVANQRKQVRSARDDNALAAIPSLSFFSKAQDIRHTDTGVDHRDEDDQSSSDKNSTTAVHDRRGSNHTFHSKFMEHMLEESSSESSMDSELIKRSVTDEAEHTLLELAYESAKSGACKLVFGRWC